MASPLFEFSASQIRQEIYSSTFSSSDFDSLELSIWASVTSPAAESMLVELEFREPNWAGWRYSEISSRLFQLKIGRVVEDFYFWSFRNRRFLKTDLQLVRLRLSIALILVGFIRFFLVPLFLPKSGLQKEYRYVSPVFGRL